MTTETVNKTKKGDVFKVDPQLVEAIEGFNVRDEYGDIESLSRSIAKKGVLQPLRGYKKNGKYILTDGHRRMRATLAAIERGVKIPFVPFITETKGYTDEDRTTDLIDLNSHKNLTAVEKAKVFKRLIDMGWTQVNIAKRFHETQANVSNTMKLLEVSDHLKDCLNKELISASVAIQIVKNYPTEKEQDKVLDSAIEKMKLLGKKKVTDKHVKPQQTQSKYHRMFDETIKVLKKQKVEKEKVEKVQMLMECLNAKSPEDMAELILNIV